MKILEKIIDISSVIMMFILFIIILLQVFFRYCLNMPLKWTEEFARYLFVWVSMIGWTYGTRYDSHIRVNIFYDMLPKKIKFFVFIFIQLLSLVFSLFLGYLSILLMKQGALFKASTLPISFAVVYAIIPIVSLILALYAIVKLFNFIKLECKI
ncbi:TRAP transporter small permease [Brachyspira pilosicoli]|uniref:TRAP transporter small permease n=1 Tax=Brachyspira pilosicoli TaxID=52584 RepID=UPI001C68331F|nr:TRAP transporter small permease [Brachyspira pilosicoli]MBW5397654.1 TRAP transporter small permease [Brachyspira pilosicoli]